MQVGNFKLRDLSGFESASFYYGPGGWGLYNQKYSR